MICNLVVVREMEYNQPPAIKYLGVRIEARRLFKSVNVHRTSLLWNLQVAGFPTTCINRYVVVFALRQLHFCCSLSFLINLIGVYGVDFVPSICWTNHTEQELPRFWIR